MSVDELIREQEFMRWLNSHPEAPRRLAFEAGWNAHAATSCHHCFCRDPVETLDRSWKSCCWCGKAGHK